MSGTYDSKVSQDELDELKWFHGIDFGNGLLTKGRLPESEPENNTLFPVYPMLESIDFADNRVIDIGTMDGLLAFILKNLGASSVAATDLFDRRSFRLAREILGYKNEISYHPHTDISRMINVFGENTFDLVAFCGVLYHLLAPLEALLICRSIIRRNGLLLLGTQCDNSSTESVLYFNMGEISQPANEPTTYFLPTIPGLLAMLRTASFDPLVLYRRIPAHRRVWIGVLARAVRPSEVRDKTTLQKRHDSYVDEPDHFAFGDRFYKLEHGEETPSTIRYAGPEGLDKEIDSRTYLLSSPPYRSSLGRDKRRTGSGAPGMQARRSWASPARVGCRSPRRCAPAPSRVATTPRRWLRSARPQSAACLR